MPTRRIRYFEHELNNQRFQPGKLSDELRSALNLHPQELPPFIYRMRVLGYPPGWLADAEIETSGITIYGLDRDGVDNANIEDGEIDSTEVRVQYDPRRLISFPGFNVPVPPGMLDMHEKYNMPPMLPHQQRSEAEKYMKAPEAKALGQRLKLPSTVPKPSTDVGPVVDMDMGDGAEEDDPPFIPINDLKSSELDQSPEDTEDSDNLVTSSELGYTTYRSESTTIEQSSEGSQPTTVVPASKAEAPYMKCLETKAPETKPPETKPREVTMGTPFLMGFSGFDRLPPRENFAKDVSPYIPFENLPGATGTYDRLRAVLNKVRVTLQENKDKTKESKSSA